MTIYCDQNEWFDSQWIYYVDHLTTWEIQQVSHWIHSLHGNFINWLFLLMSCSYDLSVCLTFLVKILNSWIFNWMLLKVVAKFGVNAHVT